MEHLFSHKGRLSMAALLAGRPLLALDFDGTLAPIVSHPADARMSEGAPALLQRLSRRLPVAIVTGRSVADVRGRLGFEPAHVVGSHGAEGLDFPLPPEALEQAQAWLHRHRAALARLEVEVEDKRHSMALHYRRSANPAAASVALEALLADLGPAMRVFGGKMVFNIVPDRAPDKADAVLELVRRTQADSAIFVGDDLNDEPVFVAAPAHWMTVKVGAPPALPAPRSAARYYLHSCAEVVSMLERMITRLESGTA